MSTKRRGLGSLGVDVLLSAASSSAADEKGGELRHLPVDSIRRGRYQPRGHIRPEALEQLTDSIRVQGLVQPLVVRPVMEEMSEGYELIAGERRWRAAQMAGLDTVPALIRPVPDQAAAAMSLIENIQREDLNPLEKAGAFQRLVEDFDLTHQQVADAVGRSRVAVTNHLRLLELREPAKQLLKEGRLEMGHARALLSLNRDLQTRAARHVATNSMSVRATERYIRGLLAAANRPASAARKDANVSRLEQRLSETLGARVEIRHDRKGKGSLVIHYTNLDELDGIIDHIN
jgi:ParB family transcriptional regulator, chromosome partitioning protein